jgi:hypothetical protein
MQFLAVIKLVISILPMLIEAIKLIEQAIPGSGNGEAKIMAVKSVVESSYTAANDAMPAFETFWPVLQKTVTGIVSAFNKSGTFSK